MIYFDNAATTLIKPDSVYRSMLNGVKKCGNPGRSGHKPSEYADECIFRCRLALADLFNIDQPEKIVFTYNATHALNFAIKSILKNGGRALISNYEHNSVVRPLESLKENGVTYTVVKSNLFDENDAYFSFKKELQKGDVKCVILNHISNVFGSELPINRIDELCFEYQVPIILDISQSAGTKEIDLSVYKSVSYACLPGHKGLLGPQGTGVLICCNDKYLYSVLQGGTGSQSLSLEQPGFLPDIYESGTLNVPGICGLCAGVEYIKKIGFDKIQQKHNFLLCCIRERLRTIKSVQMFTGVSHKHGLISFYVNGYESEEIALMLSKNNICVRGGLHCSPLAHQVSNTTKNGLVRVSFSIFNSLDEVERFYQIMKKI